MKLCARAARALAWSGVAVMASMIAAACGSRSSLYIGPPLPAEPECRVDADCIDAKDLCQLRACKWVTTETGIGPDIQVPQCVDTGKVDCDDGNPCTADTCVPETGACSYGPATLDLDGDGHRAPRPGFAPGAPESCGDDCDDSNAAAFPGNPEVCDGVDNDCNGVVDDGAAFVPLGGGDVRISGAIAPAGTGGLAYSGKSYAAAYWGDHEGFSVYLSTISDAGQVIDPPGEQPVTLQNADASGGPIVWVGDRYGLAWQDRRTGDYEIFFTLLDAEGKKAIADTQLTSAAGFSVNPAMAWNSQEFLVVWQDDRDGIHNLYGQRVSVDGAPVGPNQQLTDSVGNLGNESPSAAAGLASVGVAWSFGDASSHQVAFQAFSHDLSQPVSASILITDGTSAAVAPTVVWNKDRYVVAWYDKSAVPQAIYAATVGEDGTVITKPKAVTSPGAFRSRYPSLRPLGDRVLLVYADDRDQNQGYELYSRMLSPTLDPLSAELRITNAPRDSIYPMPAFGPEGNVGILFRDDREGGEQNVYFTRLGCIAGP